MTITPFRIGELVRRAGVSADTIRHYERLGLLGKAPRTSGGYRLLPPSTVERVSLIRDAVRVGFSLRELSTFLRARRDGRPPCRAVRAAGGRILDAIDQQIITLTATRDAVRHMLAEWDTRLAQTPAGRPAGLLEMLHVGTSAPASTPRSGLKRHR